jgi:hypothetical protein
MPSAAVSYRNRSRWRTRTGGSASRSTSWLPSLELDGPTCTDWGCETSASASWMLCTESGCAKELEVSHRDICEGGSGREEKRRTSMKSLSDRQASIATLSSWPGTRTVDRDLPPNMREMGDSIELAYSCSCRRQQRQAQCSGKE